MGNDFQAFRRQFFTRIDDPACLLRLFDFLPGVYLYVKDAEGRFVGMNRALVQLRGVDSEQKILGKTDVELHPIYLGRLYMEEDRRVLDSGREIPGQVWLVPDADGRLASFVSSKMPLRDRQGKCIGIAGVMYRLEEDRDAAQTNDQLKAATELIAQRYAGPLVVTELAAAVGLSVSQLNRRFRGTYQMSPSVYLQRVRVHEASRLLAETDSPIGDVALDTGFYDQAHLTRTFRRWMGMTPTEFRRQSQSRA